VLLVVVPPDTWSRRRASAADSWSKRGRMMVTATEIAALRWPLFALFCLFIFSYI